MTLRQQLKIPKYGLFYFDSDQTVSVVPMSKVRKVLEGDHKKSGSVVELLYGSVLQRAEIIGVDGKCHLLFYLRYSIRYHIVVLSLADFSSDNERFVLKARRTV